ncbi:MAG TPA: flagellar FliJ family protein [Terriglobales bacterium]|nr:flagellar FliJ family protein [Terriglobales bacterium]
MAFNFSLEVLLRVRQGFEHQQELLLREATCRLSSLEQQVNDVNARLADFSRRELQDLSSGVSAAELQFDLLCREALLNRRHALEIDVAKARATRDLRAAGFRQARQQREIIESLRQRQLELYRQFEARQSQRAADDMFLLRRTLSKRR